MSGLTHDADRLPLFHTRGRVLLEAGAAEAALHEFRMVGAVMDALRIRNPATLQWRSQAALAMRLLGRTEEAAELAREELKLARQWGAPRSIGIALRALGLVQGGRRGEAQLRHAVTVLEPSRAQLEHARALIDLGACCAAPTAVPMHESRFGEGLSSPTGPARWGWSSMRKTNWLPPGPGCARWR